MVELNIGGSNMMDKSTVTSMEGVTDPSTVAVADGGLEIRDFNDIRYSDDLVREYRTPPGDCLYAYRTDDGDHHIVVSRGNEPATRWERRVPATIDRPIPGQKLWSLPDNWDKKAVSEQEAIAYGLFYVPDSDVWTHVSIPTNDWLVDAWYYVNGVGDIDVDPVGNLGSSYDVRQFANEYEEKYGSEVAEEDVEAIREIASSWDIVEEELELTIDWVQHDGIEQMQSGDQPIHADSDWHIEFHQERIFRPGEMIKQCVDLTEYKIPLSVILDELRDADLLPSPYDFELLLDESAVDMEYYIRGLIEANMSPAEAVDYYMIELMGMTQTGWAEKRGVDQSTVSGNVNQAKDKLQ